MTARFYICRDKPSTGADTARLGESVVGPLRPGRPAPGYDPMILRASSWAWAIFSGATSTAPA
jgi:hypothetical protein